MLFLRYLKKITNILISVIASYVLLLKVYLQSIINLYVTRDYSRISGFYNYVLKVIKITVSISLKWVLNINLMQSSNYIMIRSSNYFDTPNISIPNFPIIPGIEIPDFPKIPSISIPDFPLIPPIVLDPDHISWIFAPALMLLFGYFRVRRSNIIIDIGLTVCIAHEGWERDFLLLNNLSTHIVKYGIYDKNDIDCFLLSLLYWPSSTLDWIICPVLDRTVGIQSHEEYFLNNGPFTYYRPEPFIPYNGLNGETIITLLVPKPTLFMWNLYSYFNITILSNNQPVQYYTEIPTHMRIYAKLIDVSNSPERI